MGKEGSSFSPEPESLYPDLAARARLASGTPRRYDAEPVYHRKSTDYIYYVLHIPQSERGAQYVARTSPQDADEVSRLQTIPGATDFLHGWYVVNSTGEGDSGSISAATWNGALYEKAKQDKAGSVERLDRLIDTGTQDVKEDTSQRFNRLGLSLHAASKLGASAEDLVWLATMTVVAGQAMEGETLQERLVIKNGTDHLHLLMPQPRHFGVRNVYGRAFRPVQIQRHIKLPPDVLSQFDIPKANRGKR